MALMSVVFDLREKAGVQASPLHPRKTKRSQRKLEEEKSKLHWNSADQLVCAFFSSFM